MSIEHPEEKEQERLNSQESIEENIEVARRKIASTKETPKRIPWSKDYFENPNYVREDLLQIARSMECDPSDITMKNPKERYTFCNGKTVTLPSYLRNAKKHLLGDLNDFRMRTEEWALHELKVIGGFQKGPRIIHM
ncbi:hypothetical protein KAR91_80280 [Candidatus Pacearchaeota archaeon]|nr:hypothetical protein [Candidatus Pacearchaeota archaeon]